MRLLASNSQVSRLPARPVDKRVVVVIRQMKRLDVEYRRGYVDHAVYHDQRWELMNALQRVTRESEEKASADRLEAFCENHPDDLECRIYDV